MKFNPNKIRVEILLPLSYNDGKPIEKSKFVNTERELAQHFGGCTTLIPVEGLWIDDDLKNTPILIRDSMWLPHLIKNP